MLLNIPPNTRLTWEQVWGQAIQWRLWAEIHKPKDVTWYTSVRFAACEGDDTALPDCSRKRLVIEHDFNKALTAIATRSDVAITNPKCTLRVVDRFTVNSEGKITAQENHYDPRAAIPDPRRSHWGEA